MSAVITVRGTFVLKARNAFVAYGDLVEGSVSKGMVMQIPLNSSVSVAAEVSGVEMVDGTPTGSHLALRFDCDDLEDAELLNALNVAGEDLRVLMSSEAEL